MATQPATDLSPHMACPACQHRVDLTGRRVGQSTRCGACQAFVVVTRSKVRGELPAAVAAGELTPEEQREVGEVLERIKLRRIGSATRHAELYPSWVVFVAGVQFYLSGILAGANLAALGDVAGGKRLQLQGVVAYLAAAGLLLGATLSGLGAALPAGVGLGLVLAVPLAFAAHFTRAQHAAASAAREAGAQPAPVVLPLLVGLILAIAQAFALWFLTLRLEGPV